jgi:tripeptide aminopeptidase
VVRDGVVYSAGDTVLGSDDKAGLAAALECVRRLSEEGGRRPTVRCVFTVQEEVGLRGAKALAEPDMSGDLCLVLDADGRPGGIVVAAPTHHTFTAEFEGRAAHAGVEPEAGVSAIAMATAAISRIPIGRIDEATTANIGTIHGGTATNVMAASVMVTGECRSTLPGRAEQVRAEMDEAMRTAATEAGGRVEIEWTHEYAGFSLPDDSPAVRVVTEACRDSGLEPHTFATGGGSDANVIAASGTPTVALSCGMSGVHGTGEKIAVADLESLARLCVATARRLANDAV